MPRKKKHRPPSQRASPLMPEVYQNGGYSLYLDTYWNGKRSYDFLKLYLNPPTDDLAIIENKTTLELAKQIKYKGFLKLQTGLHGSAFINLVRNSGTSLPNSSVKKTDSITTLVIGRPPSKCISLSWRQITQQFRRKEIFVEADHLKNYWLTPLAPSKRIYLIQTAANVAAILHLPRKINI